MVSPKSPSFKVSTTSLLCEILNLWLRLYDGKLDPLRKSITNGTYYESKISPTTKEAAHKLLLSAILEAEFELVQKIIKELHAYINLDYEFNIFNGSKQKYTYTSFTKLIKDNCDLTLTLLKPENYREKYSKILDYLSVDVYYECFPKRVVLSQSLSLFFGAEPGSKIKSLSIPDPVLESGLTLHELQCIQKMHYLYSGKSDEKLASEIEEKGASLQTIDNSRLSQYNHFPEEIESRTYISASIGFIITSNNILNKKEGTSLESKEKTEVAVRKFITFPINHENFSKFANFQKKEEAKVKEEGPHAEINLYTYMKSPVFKEWLDKNLNSYFPSNSAQSEVTVDAIFLDLHSTNCMCSPCRKSTIEEQRCDNPGNVYSVILECLKKIGVLKNDVLPAIIRVSASGGLHYLEGEGIPTYEDYEKDIRYLSTPAKVFSNNEELKSKGDSKDGAGSGSEIKSERFFQRARGSNVLLLHQTVRDYKSIYQSKYQKILERKCNIIKFKYKTFFCNGWEEGNFLHSTKRMPQELQISSAKGSITDSSRKRPRDDGYNSDGSLSGASNNLGESSKKKHKPG